MGTKVRAELAKTNKYWISKHRYYELKHFCLQYSEWKKAYDLIDEMIISSPIWDKQPSENTISNITEKCAMKKIYYSNLMEMVEKAAKEADDYIGDYILKAVTEDLSFTYLKTTMEIPCGKDMYYDRYRKFFWILSKSRN